MRVQSFKELIPSLMDRPPRVGGTRLVAVDGRSGSGKTTFAVRLARHAADAGVDVSLVHTDDLLGGWGHPSRFAPFLRQWIIDPIMAGRSAAYRSYDWHAETFGRDWHRLGRPQLLIVDGVATAAPEWNPLISFSILIDADPHTCRRRGFERDGEALRDRLAAWHAHEDEMFPHPPEGIDLVVDGDPPPGHDPDTEFVRR